MLMLGRALAHRLGGRRAPGGCGERGIAARPADEGLRCAVRRLDQAHLALQSGQRKHAVLPQRGGELLGGDAVDLVSAVGDEVEDEAHLAELFGEGPHLVVGHAGGVPVERRREVVREHLVGVHGVDGLGELSGVGEVGRLGLHPEEVGERRRGKRFRDRIGYAAADLEVAFRRFGPLAVPSGVGAQLPRLFPRGVERRTLGELPPFGGAHAARFTLALGEFEQIRDGLAERHQPGVVLPGVDELRLDLVEDGVDRNLRVVRVRGRLADQICDAVTLQPRIGGGVLTVGKGIEEVAVELGESRVVETPDHGKEAGLVGRNFQVGGAEYERLVALVSATVDQVGSLGVGARDDDARHPHDVELEAGSVETLDLFVGRHQNLAALMPTLLGARPLVLDVVSRHARFDEPLDQVAHVRIAAVAGVGVGDDERPVVDRRCPFALFLAHPQPQVLLIAVGGQQRADQAGGLVGHLAQRIAGQVGPRVFADRALGGGCPTAEVDALDAHPLHGHCLPRRVWAEGGDALALGEELTQPRVKGLRRLSRNDVIAGDGAALLYNLACGVEASDSLEPRAVEVALRGGDIPVKAVLECCTCLGVRVDVPWSFAPLPAQFPR